MNRGSPPPTKQRGAANAAPSSYALTPSKNNDSAGNLTVFLPCELQSALIGMDSYSNPAYAQL